MSKIFQKFTIVLLVMALAVGFIAPQRVDAVVVLTIRKFTMPTDPDFILNQIVKPAVRIAVRIMLQETTQQIVRWIQGERGVGYVRNPQSFIRSVADKAGGEFLNQLSGVNLCGNIGAFLQISLRTPPGLQQKLDCSLTDIVQNVESFYRNFNNGGWPAFIRASVEPQNNPYGAYLIALEAKADAESSAVQSGLFKLQASYPFLGFEVEKPGQNCVAPPGTNESEVVCNTEYETLTPGQLIASQLSKAAGSGIDYAINSNDIDASISTIVQALINKLISSTLVNRDTPGGRTGAGDIPLPAIENANFFVTRVRNSIALADSILVSIDNSLKNSYQQLFALRRNPPPASPEEPSSADAIRVLEEKIARLHQSKRNALSIKTELLTLKRSLISTADPRQLIDLGNSIYQFDSSLSSIASEAEITAAPSTSVGNLKWDTVQEIRGNLDSLSSGISLIGTMADEANRLASSTASSPRRTELERLSADLLNNQARPLQNLQTSLTLLKDRLERALRNEDIVAISSETMPALERVNIPLQNANDAVQAADIVLRRQ